MRKGRSIFSRILQLFPKGEWYPLVKETHSHRNMKGLPCRDPFGAMLFCQLVKAQSLREIGYGLATFQGKMSPPGVKKAPGRSTLSYANEHRPWHLYERWFDTV